MLRYSSPKGIDNCIILCDLEKYYTGYMSLVTIEKEVTTDEKLSYI